MKNTAYIALGSNVGARLGNMATAIQMLDEDEQIQIIDTSSIYETDPVGYEEQELFLNMVIKVNTTLESLELLDTCLKIESKLGRKREIKWGPRTIDLDILLFNHENVKTEKLTIPHPRMHERAFVIVPLLEISENIKLPTMETPLKSLLEEIPDREGVRMWKRKNGEDVFALIES